MELRTPVIASVPTDTGAIEVTGQIWGVTTKQPQTYDIYDLAARQWYRDVPAERVRRVES